MLLDQVAFEYERFEFTVRHDIFKPGNLLDHAGNFRRHVTALLKILPDPVF